MDLLLPAPSSDEWPPARFSSTPRGLSCRGPASLDVISARFHCRHRGAAMAGCVVYAKKLLLLVLLFGFGFPEFACAAIRYEVSLARPEQHLFHVAMEIPNVDSEVKLQM